MLILRGNSLSYKEDAKRGREGEREESDLGSFSTPLVLSSLQKPTTWSKAAPFSLSLSINPLFRSLSLSLSLLFPGTGSTFSYESDSKKLVFWLFDPFCDVGSLCFALFRSRFVSITRLLGSVRAFPLHFCLLIAFLVLSAWIGCCFIYLGVIGLKKVEFLLGLLGGCNSISLWAVRLLATCIHFCSSNLAMFYFSVFFNMWDSDFSCSMSCSPTIVPLCRWLCRLGSVPSYKVGIFPAKQSSRKLEFCAFFRSSNVRFLSFFFVSSINQL